MRHTLTEHLVRWFVLSLVGAAWLALMPRAFGQGPRLVAGAQTLSPVEVVGVLFLLLAWLGFIYRVFQRERAWRADPASVMLVALVLAAVATSVVGALIGVTAVWVVALAAKALAQVALALRVDRQPATRGASAVRTGVRGTPPAP